MRGYKNRKTGEDKGRKKECEKREAKEQIWRYKYSSKKYGSTYIPPG